MDYKTVKRAYDEGYLNKEHLEWIFEDRADLMHSIKKARAVLLQVRDNSYRSTAGGKALIDEVVKELVEHKDLRGNKNDKVA